MRADGNKKGIFTRSRQPKRAAYLLKDRWQGLPPDYKSDRRKAAGLSGGGNDRYKGDKL